MRRIMLAVALTALIAAPAAEARPAKVRTAPGASNTTLSYEMRAKLSKPRAAHQFEWGGSPWGSTVPERALDCVDVAGLRDDPPICAPYTNSRYAGTSWWYGTRRDLLGNWPAAASSPLSTSYQHMSVATEALGWLSGTNLYNDCRSRLGYYNADGNPLSLRTLGTNSDYSLRYSNTYTRPVALVAANGTTGPGGTGVPYRSACVYSFEVTGYDSSFGYPVGVSFHGVYSWAG